MALYNRSKNENNINQNNLLSWKPQSVIFFQLTDSVPTRPRPLPLTVDVEAPRVLDLAGRHDGVLGPAAQHLAHVGRLRLVAQRALGHVAAVGGLK